MASGLAGHSRETVSAEPNVTETKCRLQEYEYSVYSIMQKKSNCYRTARLYSIVHCTRTSLLRLKRNTAHLRVHVLV